MWTPKIGHVHFRWSKDLPVGKGADKLDKVTGARLVREADGWHVVFRVQTEVVDPTPHTGPTVGIDRGIAKPLALSDGTFREHSPWLTPGETKGCAAWRSHPLASATPARRVRRRPGVSPACTTRSPSSAQKPSAGRPTGSTRPPPAIAETFSRAGVEDLAITSMVKSVKGTMEAPGRNVRQKAGLNRSIAGQAWGRTVTLLEYKMADRGGTVVKVPAPNTSRRCSACGFITPRKSGGSGQVRLQESRLRVRGPRGHQRRTEHRSRRRTGGVRTAESSPVGRP
ncbi:RNA-guided endonuclease InsQ/TnpB family protein [Streptomyces chartreusis]